MITDLYVKEIFIDSEIPKENYIYDLPVVKFLKNNRLKLTKPVTRRFLENPGKMFNYLFKN